MSKLNFEWRCRSQPWRPMLKRLVLMRTITIEEHFVSPGFVAGPGQEFLAGIRSRGPRGAKIFEQLQEIGSRRIAEMDACGIDVQVLSLNSPGVEQAAPADQLALATVSNDFVAAAVARSPGRFYAFAALPTATPDQAAAELERRVGNQKFAGTLINGHIRGRYLDDGFFWPIFECAEALGAPIYLHPTVPPKAVVDASYKGFAPQVTSLLASAGWGWVGI